MNTPVDPALRRRNRTMLVVIAVVFFGSAIVAGALRFSGWRPEGMRNHGELLQPPGDLRQAVAHHLDGSDYRWNPAERRWRIAVAPPADCGASCVQLSKDLDTVWQLFGRNADHVDTLWIGGLPAGATRNASTRELRDEPSLRDGLPRAADPAGTPVYVIDPNGFVILRYAPGADPAHLREDMARLLKLK